MRDWQQHVRERLGSSGLGRAEDEEIAGELAGHLEENYEAFRVQGLSEDEAFLRTCEQAGNWDELRRGVILARQEGMMRDRVKQLWVPSLLSLLMSWAVLALILWVGIRPLIWNEGPPWSVIVYVPWLMLLPFVGAAGAYLSRRAQWTGWRPYVAGAFPALAMGCVILMILPFSFIVDPQVVPGLKFASVAAATVSWVVLPGIALCVGVAFQRIANRLRCSGRKY
jgi:hypothetical protein